MTSGRNIRLVAFMVMAGSCVQSQTASVALGAEKARSTTLDIAGSVWHPRLSNANIQVHVGASSINGQADVGGRFIITVDCTELDDLVWIEAEGVGEQSDIAYARLIHSCSYLVNKADENNVFESGVISPLSTAVYAGLRWFVQDHDFLSWPVAVPDIEPYLNIVQLNRTGIIVRGLAYVASDAMDLPPGFETTLDFVLDRSSFAPFVAAGDQAVPWEEIFPVLQMGSWDARLYRRPSTPAAPEAMITYCSAIGYHCSWYADMSADKTMFYSMGFSGGFGEWMDRGLQSVIFGDRMEVPEDNLRAIRFSGTDDEPLGVTQGWIFIDGEQILRENQITWKDVRMADASELISLMAVASQTKVTYPENPEIEETITESSLPSFRNGILSLSEFPNWQVPQENEDWVLPMRELKEGSTQQGWSAYLITLNADGSASVLDSDSELDWGIEGQTLILTGADIASHHYHFIGGIENRHDSFLLEVDRAQESIIFSQFSGIRASDLTPFNVTNVPGRYVGGFSIDDVLNASMESLDEVFVLDLLEGGDGYQAILADSDQLMPQDAVELSWEIDAEGRVVIERPASGISIFRRWQRVAVDTENEDVYLLEAGPDVVLEGEAPSFSEGRLNFYRKIAIPQ